MGAMEAIAAIVKNAWSSAPRIANLNTWLKLHNQHTKNLSTKLLPGARFLPQNRPESIWRPASARSQLKALSGTLSGFKVRSPGDGRGKGKDKGREKEEKGVGEK